MSFKQENPKSILVLDKIQSKSVKWEKDYDPNGETQIISIDELNQLPYNFEEKPKIGQFYIQHPFQYNIYLTLTPDLNPDEFEKLKLNNLAQLGAILGAKHFKSTLINREEVTQEKQGTMQVSIPVGGLQVGGKNELGNIIGSSYELDIQFEGSFPNYEQACNYAIETGLSRDKIIWSFIEKRNPKHNNLAKRHKEKINLSKEINKNLEIGASLKAFAGKLNIDAKYSSKDIKKEIVELEVYFKF